MIPEAKRIANIRYLWKEVKRMRRLVIDGNEVYEIDENCMLKKKVEQEKEKKEAQKRAVMKNRNTKQ